MKSLMYNFEIGICQVSPELDIPKRNWSVIWPWRLIHCLCLPVSHILGSFGWAAHMACQPAMPFASLLNCLDAGTSRLTALYGNSKFDPLQNPPATGKPGSKPMKTKAGCHHGNAYELVARWDQPHTNYCKSK